MSRRTFTALTVSVVVVLIGIALAHWLIPLGLGVGAGACVEEYLLAPQRRPAPGVPVNVRLIRHGETIPLELIYVGFDREGFHRWKAVTPVHIEMSGEWTIKADVLPARTRIIMGEGD